MNGNETGAGISAATGKKIDRETAESEFVQFCENNGIEHDETAINDEEKNSFSEIKRHFINACMDGRVEVDGTSLKYTVSKFSPDGFKGEVLTIKRPAGQSFVAMDGWKDERSVQRLLGFFSANVGKDMKYFTKLDIIDWKFLNSIATLFLSL